METSTSAATELRVAVVARDSLARAGLAALLADQPGLAVIGQTPSHAGVLAEMEVYHPDVVLWDLGWDPPAAMDGLAELREAGVRLVEDPAPLGWRVDVVVVAFDRGGYQYHGRVRALAEGAREGGLEF